MSAFVIVRYATVRPTLGHHYSGRAFYENFNLRQFYWAINKPCRITTNKLTLSGRTHKV